MLTEARPVNTQCDAPVMPNLLPRTSLAAWRQNRYRIEDELQ
jgi:hypothetical protein